jgi:phosphatidylglycerophosphatase A
MSSSAPSIAASSPKRKPRISLAIATALGLGYIPKAPGTFGSLAGVALALASMYVSRLLASTSIFDVRFVGCPIAPCGMYDPARWYTPADFPFGLLLVISLVGIWTASRTAAYLRSQDPQIVVIDEVAGQYLALAVGALWPFHIEATNPYAGPYSPRNLVMHPLNWKCVLAGFILFRVFDIWKPFPARQAESLPRGWGIMADDCIAGLYAALGLWALRAAGL